MQLAIDCEAMYFSDFLSEQMANELFEYLVQQLSQQSHIPMANGQLYQDQLHHRLFVNPDIVEKQLLPSAWGQLKAWPPPLYQLKQRVEQKLGQSFGVCVYLLYSDGTKGMYYHSDLPAYGPTDCIASISLGAERQFSFRRMDDVSEQCNLVLQNGSLLVMGQHCQQRYQHAILPQSDCQQPRINLTFRKFDYNIHTKSYH